MASTHNERPSRFLVRPGADAETSHAETAIRLGIRSKLSCPGSGQRAMCGAQRCCRDCLPLMRMRVGINTAIKCRGTSGTARLVEFIERALSACPDVELVVVHPRRAASRARPIRALSEVRWDLWEAARAVPTLDIFTSPCNVGRTPRNLPHLLWMLDTMPLDHPEWYGRAFAAYARVLFGFSARGSTRLVTISQHSADRIESQWPQVAPVDVLRLPAAVHAGSPRQIPEPPLRVIAVGATHLYKNHSAAIEAVSLAREASGLDIRFDMVGPEGRAEGHIRELGRGVDPTGAWFNRHVDIPEQELDERYRTAWALIQPSLDEGFGLSLLEAAGHALPVVHSGRGAMPEVIRTGNVGSVGGTRLGEGLLELLDADRYRDRSASVLEDALAYVADDFRRDLLDLLQATCRSSTTARLAFPPR
jgi:glycosyltransferase involved in cell wall biosynthesis